MTTTKTGSRARSEARPEGATTPSPVTSTTTSGPIPEAAEESQRLATAQAIKNLIEEERIRLMKAESVLECAMLAMDETDFEQTHGPYYQNVIGVARDLILQSIDQLDSVRVGPLLERLALRGGPGVKEGVKEGVAAYLH